jgi:hypothetical protein
LSVPKNANPAGNPAIYLSLLKSHIQIPATYPDLSMQPFRVGHHTMMQWGGQ